MGKTIVHFLPALVSGLIVQLVLHEAGHLLGGLLTGWEFLYLQIYGLVVKRESKKLKLMTVGDTGFRCIMSPVSIDNKALMYTMGGCLANLFSGMAGLAVVIMADMPQVLWLYTWCFSAIGISFFVINGVESNKRLCNDGTCRRLLKSDGYNLICHNAQLMAAKYLLTGISYGEIGDDIICLCPDKAENDITACQAVLEYYHYLDTGDYAKAENALNKVRDTRNLCREISYIVELERAYIKLFASDKNPDVTTIKAIINKHAKKKDVHSLRILALYDARELFLAGYGDKAKKRIGKAIDHIRKTNCIFEGDRIFCIKQLREMSHFFNS